MFLLIEAIANAAFRIGHWRWAAQVSWWAACKQALKRIRKSAKPDSWELYQDPPI